jgi:hypothetical protein
MPDWARESRLACSHQGRFGCVYEVAGSGPFAVQGSLWDARHEKVLEQYANDLRVEKGMDTGTTAREIFTKAR